MERFARLCEISSPTGQEAGMAAEVRRQLEGLGLKVEEDDAAGPAGAASGNLLARIPGSGDGWLMLCAHLDTVPHEGPIEVVERDGVFRSAGDTILGADNKAAVAVLLELAQRHASGDPPAVGLELLFTVAEEQGLRGAAAFDSGVLRSEVGFVFDHATPIGELITAAPSLIRLRAEFTGREAHAGIVPEQGRSAIAAAASAVAGMRLGRVDEESTANVGRIRGGSSDNVIPGCCRIAGEARSLDPDHASELIGEMSDACVAAGTEHACELDLVTEAVSVGYTVPEDARSLGLAESALRRAGVEPERVSTGGLSDAHVFRARGMDCLLMANGTEAAHTFEESVSRAALERMVEVCEALVIEAAA